MWCFLILLVTCIGVSQQQDTSQQGIGNTQQPAPDAQQPQQPAQGQPSQGQQQQPAPDDQQKKSKFGGLFKKPVTASNSAQPKDTASLGPNGLDPDGMPSKALLNESPTGADEAKAQAMSTQTTDKTQVDQFIQQGNLKLGKS